MSTFIRQAHRWIAIAFVLVVIANFAALAAGHEVEWLSYLPLPPLFLLMGSGLYLFVLPHMAGWRARRGSGT